MELMRPQVKVAETRRRLPQSPQIRDYIFEEGSADLNAGDSSVRNVRTGADRALIIHYFMFGKKNTKSCPMCTVS
jgi:predicted dithiol-disulfide oxidoreductase (DUF899 family)